MKRLQSNIVLDLRGFSVIEAKAAIFKFLEEAIKNNSDRVLVITGIGRHWHARKTRFRRGQFIQTTSDQKGRPRDRRVNRGILLKVFPKLLSDFPFKFKINYVFERRGSYKVMLRPNAIDRFNCGENPLFQIIQAHYEVQARHSALETLLSQNPALIRKAAPDGMTVLMIAASYDQVETMAWLLLQEKLLMTQARLLKQACMNGSHVLMIAIQHNSQQAIHFLLKRAPSLLKKRRSDGTSVFTIAGQSANASQIVPLLYQYLEPHKRERGYTGLFREYKMLMRGMDPGPLIPNHSRISVVESEAKKRQQGLVRARSALRSKAFPSKRFNDRSVKMIISTRAFELPMPKKIESLVFLYKKNVSEDEARTIALKKTQSNKKKKL